MDKSLPPKDWGRGGVRPTPSQPLQPHQRHRAQGHPSPVDGAESGNGFQLQRVLACWPQRPGGCQAEPAWAVNTPNSRRKEALGSSELSCFQVAAEESGGKLRMLPAWRDMPSKPPGACSTAPHVPCCAVLGVAAGYFQYFERNNVYVMFATGNLLVVFDGCQTSLGRPRFWKRVWGARPGPPASTVEPESGLDVHSASGGAA